MSPDRRANRRRTRPAAPAASRAPPSAARGRSRRAASSSAPACRSRWCRPRRRPADPFGALVGHRHRLVVVEGGDQVAVVCRQFQVFQCRAAVPVAAADDQRALRVAGADDRQHGRQRLVPALARQFAVGFVEHLEQHGRRCVAVVLGDLPPYGEEALTFGGGLEHHVGVVMHVEHDGQLVLQCQLHDAVDPLEEVRRDPVGRLHPGARVPAHRQPDGGEAGLRGEHDELVAQHRPGPCLHGRGRACCRS